MNSMLSDYAMNAYAMSVNQDAYAASRPQAKNIPNPTQLNQEANRVLKSAREKVVEKVAEQNNAARTKVLRTNPLVAEDSYNLVPLRVLASQGFS